MSSDEEMDKVINDAREELNKNLKIDDLDYDTKILEDKWYT